MKYRTSYETNCREWKTCDEIEPLEQVINTRRDMQENYKIKKERYNIKYNSYYTLFRDVDKDILDEQLNVVRNEFAYEDNKLLNLYKNSEEHLSKIKRTHSKEAYCKRINKRIKETYDYLKKCGEIAEDVEPPQYKQWQINYRFRKLERKHQVISRQYSPVKGDNHFRGDVAWRTDGNLIYKYGKIPEKQVKNIKTENTNKIYSKKNIISNKTKTNNIVEVNSKEYTKEDLKAIREKYINSYIGFRINHENKYKTAYLSRKIYMMYDRGNKNVDIFNSYIKNNDNSNIFEYYKNNTIENIEDIFNDAEEQFELIKQRFILYKEAILDKYANSTHESLPEINEELAQIAKLLIDEKFRLVEHRNLSQRTKTIKLLNDYYANILKYFNNPLNFSLGDTSLKEIINLKLELIAFITRYYCSIPGDKEITMLCQIYDEYKKRYNKDIYKIKAEDVAEVVLYDYCRLQHIKKAGVYVYYYLHQDEFKEKTNWTSFSMEKFNTAYNTSNFNKRCERYDDFLDEPEKIKWSNELDNNKVKNVLLLRRDKNGNILDYHDCIYNKDRILDYEEKDAKYWINWDINNTRELMLINNLKISDKEKDILAIKYLKQNIAKGTMDEIAERRWTLFAYLVADLLEDEDKENIYINISNKDISNKDNIISEEVEDKEIEEQKEWKYIKKYKNIPDSWKSYKPTEIEINRYEYIKSIVGRTTNGVTYTLKTFFEELPQYYKEEAALWYFTNLAEKDFNLA